jgi:hypothetical protein
MGFTSRLYPGDPTLLLLEKSLGSPAPVAEPADA